MKRVSSPVFELIGESEQFNTYGGTVKDRHHRAHVIVKVPHEILDNHGILAAPGLADGTVGLDYMTNGISEEGRVSFSLDHARTNDDEYDEDPEGHKASTLHLATSSVTKQFGLEKEVDIVAHSEAGGNGSRFACKHPELVRTFTGLGIGGLIEGDTPLKITKRSTRNAPHMACEMAPRLLKDPCHTIHIIGSCVGYIASNPPKAFGEAVAISSHDIRHRFILLHNDGIGTHNVIFGKDEFFPPKLVNQSTDDGRLFNLSTPYPYDPNAGHLTPQIHPRLVGKMVLDGIDTLIDSGYVGGKTKESYDDRPAAPLKLGLRAWLGLTS